MVAKKFANGHPKAGDKTHFEEMIMSGKKIHTIRHNYDFWNDRVRQINEGFAQLSLREWTGKPYNSKQRVIKNLTKSDGVGIQKLNIIDHGNFWFVKISDQDDTTVIHNKCRSYNGESYDTRLLSIIAKNDGLTKKEFMAWFKDVDSNPKALIHFTPFRY